RAAVGPLAPSARAPVPPVPNRPPRRSRMTPTHVIRTATPPPKTTTPRRRRRPTRRHGIAYFLLAPAVLILAIGLGYPVRWQILNSFKEYGLAQQFGQPAPWVGFDNYVRVFTSEALWAVVARSVAFCLVNAFVTVAIGVAF